MRTLRLWNEAEANRPWVGLVEMQRNLDRVLDRTFGSSFDGHEGWAFQPAAEVQETATHYVLTFDTPGVAKKDLQIEVHGNEISVRGERQNEGKSNGFTERTYGKFHRTFTLPIDLDLEKIEAHYEDGVLTVAVPKAESAKPRTIKIGEGKPSFFEKLLGTKEAKTESDIKGQNEGV